MTEIVESKKKPSELLQVPIGCGTLEEITARSMRAVDGAGGRVTFACANPHSLVMAQQDAEFMTALRATDLVVADGVGVTVMARLLGIDVGPRITGTAYFLSVMRALQARGHGRVFFFGSSNAVLGRIAARMKDDFPALTVCGSLSPPYRPWSADENATMLEEINRARPDVLWVGMTAPKQERWVHANAGRLTAPVVGSIGAVFDFYAGTNPRAPQWMCDLGLEWIYRLVREPRRMWRRTFVSGPRFVGKALSHHIF